MSREEGIGKTRPKQRRLMSSRKCVSVCLGEGSVMRGGERGRERDRERESGRDRAREGAIKTEHSYT